VVAGAPACAALGTVEGGAAGACAAGVVTVPGIDAADDVLPSGVPARSMVPTISAALRATTAPRLTQIGFRLRRPDAPMDATTRFAGSDVTASPPAERSGFRPLDARVPVREFI
jgi:hypothetical protein